MNSGSPVKNNFQHGAAHIQDEDNILGAGQTVGTEPVLSVCGTKFSQESLSLISDLCMK